MITAEDVLIKKGVLLKTIEESGNFPLNLTRDAHIGSAKKIKQAMIEFAEFHVQEALKAKVDAMNLYHNEGYSITEMDAFTKYAYPLENIK